MPLWAGPDHSNDRNRYGGGGGCSRNVHCLGYSLFCDDGTGIGCWTWGSDAIPTFGAVQAGFYANLVTDDGTTQDEHIPNTSTAVTERAGNILLTMFKLSMNYPSSILYNFMYFTEVLVNE